MVEAGTYSAKPVKVLDDDGTQVACVFGESERTVVPFVAVEFEITDGEFAGQRLPWRGYFSGKATDIVAASLVACGFTGEDLESYPSQSPDKTVQVVVEHQEYEGEITARVAWVNGPRKVKKLDSVGLKTLGATLKSVIQAARVGSSEPDEKPADEAPKTKKSKKAPF